MDKSQVQLIQQKLVNMDGYLQELTPYVGIPLPTYLKQPGQRRIVERLVQVIVESAIDTNNLLLAASGSLPTSSARDSFDAVCNLGAIDDRLRVRFNRTYVGLRNRIVHDYEALDNRMVYAAARRLLKDAAKYIQSIRRYLNHHRQEVLQ
jgi:uncharacterized protein YutE (UPF0331/DUF86 family)